MTTDKPKAARKSPQRLSIREQLAHEHNMAVRQSTATFDMLNQRDGKLTQRLIYLGFEYADAFLGSRAE